jgi:hypothetical protein
MELVNTMKTVLNPKKHVDTGKTSLCMTQNTFDLVQQFRHHMKGCMKDACTVIRSNNFRWHTKINLIATAA